MVSTTENDIMGYELALGELTKKEKTEHLQRGFPETESPIAKNTIVLAPPLKNGSTVSMEAIPVTFPIRQACLPALEEDASTATVPGARENSPCTARPCTRG